MKRRRQTLIMYLVNELGITTFYFLKLLLKTTNLNLKQFKFEIWESQRTFDVIGVRKAQENFVNHLADISTTNGSDAEEKLEQDQKSITEKDEIKHINNANEAVSNNIKIIEAEQENVIQDSVSKEKQVQNKTNKAADDDKEKKKNDVIVDEWSLFEEFDKKITKSQKKKQKRRSKKKAEQELQKLRRKHNKKKRKGSNN